MAQRHHHYEKAFEEFLRERKIPYVVVDEARKALLPEGALLTVTETDAAGTAHTAAIKSFDFIIYGQGSNLLVEVKGRRAAARKRGTQRHEDPVEATRPARARLDSWATLDDVESLSRWQALFGPGFEAALVFVYWCEEQPPDALFDEVFEHRGRWYAVRAITLANYLAAMKTRSPRWRTVHVPPALFERLSQPLSGPANFAATSGTPDDARAAPPMPVLDRLQPGQHASTELRRARQPEPRPAGRTIPP